LHSETNADTEFESDAVAAWASRTEKQLSDAIQSGSSEQIDEALMVATEYRSSGIILMNCFWFSL
jgi:threonine synthase